MNSLSKSLPKRFCSKSEIFDLTIRKRTLFWLRSTKCPLLRKKKNRCFFGEIFLKVWKFSTQKRELKKTFSLEKSTKTLFCTRLLAFLFRYFEKLAEFFWPKHRQKCSSSEKKNKKRWKSNIFVFHILHGLSETLLKSFLLQPGIFELTVQKNRSLWENKCAKMTSALER